MGCWVDLQLIFFDFSYKNSISVLMLFIYFIAKLKILNLLLVNSNVHC